MNPVSTYSFLLSQQMIMTNTAQLSQKLSNQLSTGKKATDLAENQDRERILNLSLVKNNREGYVKSCTLGELVTSQYTISLKHIETLASNALKAIEGLRTTFTGIASTGAAQQNIDALNQFTSLGNTINQTMVDTQISLNEKSASGDGYLYSGLRTPTSSPNPTWTNPPVQDLTKLPYFLGTNQPVQVPQQIPGYDPPNVIIPPAITGVGVVAVDPISSLINTNLPVYDSDYVTLQTSTNQKQLVNWAYGKQSITIDDNESVGINITSTDPAFQNMINGLRAAKTACDNAGTYSTADRDAYMDLAYSNLLKSVDGIRILEQQNTVTDTAMQTKSKLHNDSLNIINTRLDELIGVDTTSVTVQLATANNQLQASYKATATLLGMSLMNYLK